VKVLAISDVVEPLLHGPGLKTYARGIEAAISCGDLPFDYLEYVVTVVGVPLYYVLGNHDPDERQQAPQGCVPLGGRVVDAGDGGDDGGGVVLAGLSGSPWYSGGPNQFTEGQMRREARRLGRRLAWNRMRGRGAPDAIVTHAPPFGLGDREDQAHVGFEAFLGLMDRHEPPLWLHGHVHLYGPEEKAGRETSRKTEHGTTRVVNVYGHQVLHVGRPEAGGFAPAGRGV
jgi:Icc-related predicted phosphoesterase